ncbi:hypothetical protein BS329_20885 [Amycolatopsis coloradensis]|uniref:Uncharacterized protein n=1 Tax=Amycolatopsis coloradensis TaxID=76021 RepID=A0A1R0KR00_9PSEU|nr:hypothetical protein BS329_20885 [Amycolatopsis coloradensis]
MVAEGVSDHGAGMVRTWCSMAAMRPVVVGMPSPVTSVPSDLGCIGCPARRPGNSQRQFGLVALFMLSRWAAP